jgi:hypothetical protein
VAGVGGVTGGGLATVGVAAGGGTGDFGFVRLRTTTGFVIGWCGCPGIAALFLGSTHNAILRSGGSGYSASLERPLMRQHELTPGLLHHAKGIILVACCASCYIYSRQVTPTPLREHGHAT